MVYLKLGPHLPAKSAKIIVLSSIFGPHGILKRIHRIRRIHRKRNMAGRTDPGFPTPGAKMTVVYTNSLKSYYIFEYYIHIYIYIYILREFV